MSRTTLVGIDGQASSLRALEWAQHRASHVGGSIRAVWVLDLPPAPVDPAPLVEATEAALTADVAVVAAPGTPITTEAVLGDPLTEIERLSREVDLVVIGTNFRPNLPGRIRGTRAIRIAAEAATPVVVVPDVDLSDRSGIVVGYDGSAGASHALQFAAAEAVRSEQKLVILQACPFPSNTMGIYADLTSTLEDMLDRARHELAATARRLTEEHPGLEVSCRVTVARPAELLAEAGKSALLVVVGSRGLGPVRRWLMGSVSTEALLNLTGPIAVVR